MTQTANTTRGGFTYHKAGHDFYLFTVWNAGSASCGVHSVTHSELQRNIESLERMGYSLMRNR